MQHVIMKKQDRKNYSAPAVSVVEFKVEEGMATSDIKIVQPNTDIDGMNERMQDGSTLNWNWHVD